MVIKMPDLRTSSLFEYVWMKETSPAFKDGVHELTLFNPDIEPLQPPCIRYGWTDPMNAEHRERIGQYSKFLQKQVLQKFQELNIDGWSYVDKAKQTETSPNAPNSISSPKGDTFGKDVKEKGKKITPNLTGSGNENADIPNVEGQGEETDSGIQSGDGIKPKDSDQWSDALKDTAAQATYLGCVVDTAFILLPERRVQKKGKKGEVIPKAVSRNYCKDGKVIGNDEREITEADIEFPELDKMMTEGENEYFVSDTVRVITQNSKKDNRNCVVIQPKWIISDPFGECILKAELQTALEKMYLRFYEMLSLHKGGILSETYVVPKGVADDVTRKTKAEMVRGMLGFGRILKVNAAKSLNDQFKYEATPMGTLDFGVIATHINQDVDLSKQAMEGGGGDGSGANPLTGLNPLMNEQSDKKLQNRLSDIYKKVIKDINFVLYKKDPESYDVEFNKSEDMMMNQVAKDEVNRNERKGDQIKSDNPQAALGKSTGKQPNRQSRGY